MKHGSPTTGVESSTRLVRLLGRLSVRVRVETKGAPGVLARVNKVSERDARHGESSEPARTEARGDFHQGIFVQGRHDDGTLDVGRVARATTVEEGEPRSSEHVGVRGVGREGATEDDIGGHRPVSYTHLTLPTTPYV